MKAKIYIKTTCPFCVRALELLLERNIETEVIDVKEFPQERERLRSELNYHTVPIIFLDDEFIGGCSELMALDAEGKLGG